MTDQLSLYNGALRFLGQRSLVSLAENRESRRMLDEVWNDGAINACLEQGWWKFATRTVQLTADPSFVSGFGYRYKFDRPTPGDYVRLGGFCADQYLRSTIDAYVVEGGFFYCDVNPVWMAYVSNDPAFGLNYAIWPETFNQFVQAFIGTQAMARFKKTPAEQKGYLDQLRDLKRDARSKDAAEGPVKQMQLGSWARARLGGNLGGDRLRGGRLTG
jgi:hypothetical protein